MQKITLSSFGIWKRKESLPTQWKDQVLVGGVWSLYELQYELKLHSNIILESCWLYLCGPPLNIHHWEATRSLMCSAAPRPLLKQTIRLNSSSRRHPTAQALFACSCCSRSPQGLASVLTLSPTAPISDGEGRKVLLHCLGYVLLSSIIENSTFPADYVIRISHLKLEL